MLKACPSAMAIVFAFCYSPDDVRKKKKNQTGDIGEFLPSLLSPSSLGWRRPGGAEAPASSWEPQHKSPGTTSAAQAALPALAVDVGHRLGHRSLDLGIWGRS